ncbi:MAG: GNAT family N-acetyltransferase [Clostridia bacterium]|nr:GNAT family N-acetyltransferase [Clostridia bacterium]
MNTVDVSIRKWEVSDAKDLAEALCNKKVLDNLRDGLPFPYTEKDALDYISAMQAANPNDTFAFAIVYNGNVVGSIGVFRKDNIHNRTAELGYYLAEEHWGKGIMTSAVKLTCDFVFANSDIIRIFSEPFARNIGSCRVLEKAGFTFEGVMRSNAVKNGVVEDMKLYSRLRMDN